MTETQLDLRDVYRLLISTYKPLSSPHTCIQLAHRLGLDLTTRHAQSFRTLFDRLDSHPPVLRTFEMAKPLIPKRYHELTECFYLCEGNLEETWATFNIGRTHQDRLNIDRTQYRLPPQKFTNPRNYDCRSAHELSDEFVLRKDTFYK